MPTSGTQGRFDSQNAKAEGLNQGRRAEWICELQRLCMDKECRAEQSTLGGLEGSEGAQGAKPAEDVQSASGGIGAAAAQLSLCQRLHQVRPAGCLHGLRVRLQRQQAAVQHFGRLLHTVVLIRHFSPLQHGKAIEGNQESASSTSKLPFSTLDASCTWKC